MIGSMCEDQWIQHGWECWGNGLDVDVDGEWINRLGKCWINACDVADKLEEKERNVGRGVVWWEISG